MGKISQGILGGFSGKVGNVVGASWKGISYIRIMPASVANPRTEGQVNQRNTFTAVLQFLQAQLSFVKVGYKFYQNKQSAMNAAMSYILKNATTGTAPNFEVDYANALLSRGKLQSAIGSGVTATSGAANVTWTNNSTQGNARPDDLAMVLVYSPLNRESVIMLEDATRADASLEVEYPSYFVGDSLEVYLAFQAADGSSVSNSVHVGTVTAV